MKTITFELEGKKFAIRADARKVGFVKLTLGSKSDKAFRDSLQQHLIEKLEIDTFVKCFHTKDVDLEQYFRNNLEDVMFELAQLGLFQIFADCFGDIPLNEIESKEIKPNSSFDNAVDTTHYTKH